MVLKNTSTAFYIYLALLEGSRGDKNEIAETRKG